MGVAALTRAADPEEQVADSGVRQDYVRPGVAIRHGAPSLDVRANARNGASHGEVGIAPVSSLTLG